MPSLTDRALVLRRFPYSESSLVVHVLTREHGRVHLLARGAHRPRSRYYAVLDLFDGLELEWLEREGRELGELRRGALVDRRRTLTEELERFRAGLSLLELAELGSHPGKRDRGLYDLLARQLDELDDRARDPAVALVVFELAFLQNHGLAPALASCAACGRDAPPPRSAAGRVAFSAGAGGRLCADCGAEARAAGRRVGTLPLAVLETADALLRASAEGREPPRVAEARMLLVRDFVERFLDYHLETRPRSHREFLSVPNRNAPPEAPDRRAGSSRRP